MTTAQMAVLTVILILVLIARRTHFLERLPGYRTRLHYMRLRRQAGLVEKSVDVLGEKIWYLEGGAGRPNTVLLLHGFGGEKEDWCAMARHLLKEGLRVVAPDLPGFGRNAKDPNRRHDVTTLTKWLRAIVSAIRLERFHIVGCSVGATVAGGYAAASPVEILSLTLIEPFGVRVPYQSELDKLLEKGRNPLVISEASDYDGLLAFLYARKPSMPDAVVRRRAAQAAENNAFYQRVWKEIWEGERAHLLDLLLPEVKTKVLVVLGGKSRVIHPATAEGIRITKQDAKTVVIKGCGHFVMVERPEETAEHFLRFVRGR